MIDPTKIIEGLKGAATVLRAADKIPEYEAVLDAYGQIAELQAKAYSQQLEIQKITAELEEVRKCQKAVEGSAIWADQLWLVGDERPHCLHCYEKSKRLYHLAYTRRPKLGAVHICPECRNEYRWVSGSYWAALKKSSNQEA